MSDWKSIVSSVAPTLAAGIGGKFAGMATKYICQALLGKDAASDRELDLALSDPEAIATLKKIDNDFEIEMQRIGLDKDKLTAGDRDSARTMAAETSIMPQVVLSAILLIGFFGVIGLLFTGMEGLGDQVKMIIAGLFGSLATMVMIMVKFWFGGSMNDAVTMNNIYNAIPGDKVRRK